MNVLVLGGYGAVGVHVVDGLRARGHTVFTAGRDRGRADRVVDASRWAEAGYLDAIDDVDVVVNAAGAEDPALVAATADRDVAFVDITATAYVDALARLAPGAPVVLSVGLAPGLTTLLAAAAAVAPAGPEPIDIAVVIGAGERHGAGATAWTYRLLGARFPDTHGGVPVRNFTRPQTFDLPGLGRRRLYRADFSDQYTLTRKLGVPVRTYFGLDSRVATAALPLFTRIPGASRAPQGLHLPGSDRWLVAASEPGGPMRWAHGRSQSLATGVMTVLATEAATRLGPGVRHLHEVLSLDDVPAGQGIEVADAGSSGCLPYR